MYYGLTRSLHEMVVEALRRTALTVEEVDAATCYLTWQGMQRLHPCSWAIKWMYLRNKLLLVPENLREWLPERPLSWLSAGRVRILGPDGGWPWDLAGLHFSLYNPYQRLGYGCSDEDRLLAVCRLLKAYVIRHGRPGAPKEKR